MAVVNRLPVLGLALLLAAATVAADVVVTADEVMTGTAESADVSFVELRLPQGTCRVIYTRDILEVRMPDSGRVAELAARLPGVKVALDSGQPIPAQQIRTQEILRLRLERTREARTKGLPAYGDIIDGLPMNASPAQMAARCRDMEFVLRECGRNDKVVSGLLREVSREHDALHETGFNLETCCLSGTAGGLRGACIGGEFGNDIDPGSPPSGYGGIGDWHDPGGAIIGCPVGCIVGSVIGAIAGTSLRAREATDRHRKRIARLIRRVNHAVIAEP